MGRNRLFAPVLLLVVLALAWTGMYCFLVRPELGFEPISVMGPARYELDASYQWGGNLSKVVFAPLEWLDRRFRPNFWTESFGHNDLDPSDLDLKTFVFDEEPEVASAGNEQPKGQPSADQASNDGQADCCRFKDQ